MTRYCGVRCVWTALRWRLGARGCRPASPVCRGRRLERGGSEGSRSFFLPPPPGAEALRPAPPPGLPSRIGARGGVERGPLGRLGSRSEPSPAPESRGPGPVFVGSRRDGSDTRLNRDASHAALAITLRGDLGVGLQGEVDDAPLVRWHRLQHDRPSAPSNLPGHALGETDE